jgi:adenine phosphoribosyltransferase
MDASSDSRARALISKHTRKDWPVAGVTFLSVYPLLADAWGLRTTIDHFTSRYSSSGVTHVAGLDARGFSVGTALAAALGVGFVMVRKGGKLPPPVVSRKYALEYGEAVLQVPEDMFVGNGESARVVVIDDLVATGGTMAAAVDLVKSRGAEIFEMATIIELTSLNGRANLVKETGVELHAMLTYDS